MAKYRMVVMVPTAVDFECTESNAEAQSRAKHIADSYPIVTSKCQMNEHYRPNILEIAQMSGRKRLDEAS